MPIRTRRWNDPEEPTCRSRKAEALHDSFRLLICQQLAARVRQGETVTLLCSSACVDEERCHRTLLKELIERAVSR